MLLIKRFLAQGMNGYRPIIELMKASFSGRGQHHLPIERSLVTVICLSKRFLVHRG